MSDPIKVEQHNYQGDRIWVVRDTRTDAIQSTHVRRDEAIVLAEATNKAIAEERRNPNATGRGRPRPIKYRYDAGGVIAVWLFFAGALAVLVACFAIVVRAATV